MAKKSATTRLDLAREALDTANKQDAELVARRNAALLKDDDDTAAKLLLELEALRAVARGHADKIKLLEGEAENERREAILRNHQALIARFKKTLEDSDADLAEAANLQAQVFKKLTAGIDKRETARAAFSVRSAHARAGAESIDGAAMSAGAVMALFSYELYKISARPLMGGRPGERTRPPLPGSICPRIEWNLTPDRIPPFADKMKAASAFAVSTLKAEIGSAGAISATPPAEQPRATPQPAPAAMMLRSAAEIQREVQAEADARDAMLPPEIPAFMKSGSPPPAAPPNGEPRERTPAEAGLAALLVKQAELANDVSEEGERLYEACIAEIVAAQAVVNAEQGL